MLGELADWLTSVVETFGYAGVVLATALETVFPPIASVALPAVGVAVGRGELGFAPAVAAATAGNLVGAMLLYRIAALTGTEQLAGVLERHRWLRADTATLERTERWFGERADVAVSVGRCVPAVRSLVSLPAGLFRMPFARFTLLTAIGCTFWNAALIGVGAALGSARSERELALGATLVVAGFAGGVLWLVHLRRRRSRPRRPTAPTGGGRPRSGADRQ